MEMPITEMVFIIVCILIVISFILDIVNRIIVHREEMTELLVNAQAESERINKRKPNDKSTRHP